MIKPIKDGNISHGFDEPRVMNGKKIIHGGYDIVSPTKDASIVAANTGIVVASGKSATYGNRIWIKVADNVFNVYGHMKEISPTIQIGITVDEGTYLGVIGNTGYSFGVHLHYGIETKSDGTGKKIRDLDFENLNK